MYAEWYAQCRSTSARIASESARVCEQHLSNSDRHATSYVRSFLSGVKYNNNACTHTWLRISLIVLTSTSPHSGWVCMFNSILQTTIWSERIVTCLSNDVFAAALKSCAHQHTSLFSEERTSFLRHIHTPIYKSFGMKSWIYI